MTKNKNGYIPDIESLADLLVTAYLTEEMAGDCLSSLSGQMEVHHNPEMAALFRRMADMCEETAATLLAGMEPQWRGDIHARAPRWPGGNCPGALDMTEAHYLMRPWHGLTIALEAFRNIHDFYEAIAAASRDEAVRRRALELKAQAAARARAVEEELARTPPPPQDWNHDDDPPRDQE